MHLLITDSGLGGLSVCAEAERTLRRRGAHSVRITYFNAWPEQVSGYNDMADIETRALVFDRALSAMATLTPDCIAIACNTLSIVYEHTRFRRSATVPVVGIVDAGVDLFTEALTAAPDASAALVGTRTTIESATHRARMIDRGIAPERIAAVPCHGLARAIELDPDGETVTTLIEECTAAASRTDAGTGIRRVAPASGVPLYLGICCTHYTYVREQMREALERHCGHPVRTLDPNDRLAADIVRRMAGAAPEAGSTSASPTTGDEAAAERADRAGAAPAVTVISKVAMDEGRRRSIARRVQQVSPVTADALLSYTRVPDLF